MATFTDKGIVAQFLTNDGHYPGDPQCSAIFSYTGANGEQLFAVYYSTGFRLMEEIQEMLTSPYVAEPIMLWTCTRGLTADGKRWVEDFRKGSRKGVA